MKETGLNNLFGNMNDPSMQKVLRSLAMIEDAEVKAGDYVFRDGDRSTDFYIIGLGAVEVVKVLDKETGKEKILDTLGSGDFFGEGALFTDAPRSAAVRALSDCRLFKIDKAKFFELLKNNNDIAVTFLSNMLAVVNERLRHSNNELLVLYEVSRLIADTVNGIPQVASGVLEQLLSISSNEKAFFMVINNLAKKDMVIASHGFEGGKVDLQTEVPNFDEIKSELSKEKVHFKISGKYLFLAIKKMNGELNGLIAIFNKDQDFKNDDVRLCVSVAEQLGHVIENFADREDDKGRSKLGREYLSF